MYMENIIAQAEPVYGSGEYWLTIMILAICIALFKQYLKRNGFVK
jgi:hypothetical protein